MELTVTQPVFLWIFGIIGVLVVLWLAVMLVIFVQLARLLKLANEKAADVAAMIDEVRVTVHRATEVIDETKDKVSNFVSFVTSAAGIAKVVGDIRQHWGHRDTASRTDLFADESPKRSRAGR